MTNGTNERLETEAMLEYITDNFPNSLLANGYDSAPKMIQVCMKELSVDYEEALEWLEYNTFNAFVGEFTPIYLDEMCDL